MLKYLQVKQGVLAGSIHSAEWDTTCTSHVGIVGDPLHPNRSETNKIVVLNDGHLTPETNISKLEHRVR